MSHVPDDILMAFVDGELSDEQRVWLEGLLSVDPMLRRRLEPFAVTRAALPIIFDQPMREPVPSHLIDAINTAGLKPARAAYATPPPNYVPRIKSEPKAGAGSFLDVLAGVFGSSGGRFAPAFAYGAVLAVGVGAGWLAGSNVSGGPDTDQFVIYERGGMSASGKLQEALNTTPMGQILTASGAPNTFPSIRPSHTFRSGFDGHFCRQYEVAADETQRFAGYACRSDDGTWRIAFHTEAPGGGTAQVSFAEQPKASVPALDAAIDRIVEGDVLGADDEAQIIRNGWPQAGSLNTGRN